MNDPRLPPGTKVRLELDEEQVDKYGRQLVYLYRRGTDVGSTGRASFEVGPPKMMGWTPKNDGLSFLSF